MNTAMKASDKDGEMPARSVSSTEVIVATTIGNALEFFDFTAYNFFAVLLGKLYFPTLSPLFQLVMSTGTFAIGYFFRPLGGVLIGVYADKIGRKAALTLTVGMMALSSAMIGLAPTDATIGICLVGFVISPIGGFVSDLIGRKPVIVHSRLLVIVTVLPLFYWLKAEPTVT
ncbi:hypothetical protein [Robbsia sp. KACC 23696]|uniref:hypothetical protein n=1 Tax=Robbsia sp. KACC 23696 TaxID=3149231 RepID=UPI00325BDF81